MKKFLFSGVVFLVLFFGFPLSVLADNPPESDFFQKVDPLLIGSATNTPQTFSDPGKLISRLLSFALPAAGLILFVMIIWGGFEILAGSATSKSKDAGRQRITAALIGFVLLFASYWITQIIQIVFGVKILG